MATDVPLTIEVWIDNAAKQLVAAGIASGRLDAEVMLAHTLRKSRTYLHAHGDQPLLHRERDILAARLQLRLDRTPLAYIIGHKEFYRRQFRVTPATLVPRPESEMIITLLKELYPKNVSLFPDKQPVTLADIGTGSGCLGITAKLEIPDLDVTLIDISKHALNVAEVNAAKLNAQVKVVQSDLLRDYPMAFHYLIANLPYVDEAWARSPETKHEPPLALFAKDHGLGLIKALIDQTTSLLLGSGILILEADPRQHPAIITYARHHGLRTLATRDFVLAFTKD